MNEECYVANGRRVKSERRWSREGGGDSGGRGGGAMKGRNRKPFALVTKTRCRKEPFRPFYKRKEKIAII